MKPKNMARQSPMLMRTMETTMRAAQRISPGRLPPLCRWRLFSHSIVVPSGQMELRTRTKREWAR
jgi:hypothetical protein